MQKTFSLKITLLSGQQPIILTPIRVPNKEPYIVATLYFHNHKTGNIEKIEIEEYELKELVKEIDEIKKQL